MYKNIILTIIAILLLCMCCSNIGLFSALSQQNSLINNFKNESGVDLREFNNEDFEKHDRTIFVFFKPNVNEVEIENFNNIVSRFRCVESIEYTSVEEANAEYLNMYEELHGDMSELDLPASSEVVVREMSRCNKDELESQISGEFDDSKIILDIINN